VNDGLLIKELLKITKQLRVDVDDLKRKIEKIEGLTK
jgi:hypothetical protein